MKKKINAVLITVLLTIVSIYLAAAQQIKSKALPDYTLSVGYNKTTSLIFPYPITSVDRGSRDILVQKAHGVANILEVKAASSGFDETNLTVVTADGRLYPFIVNYAANPAQLSLQFFKRESTPLPVAVFSKDATTDIIARKSLESADRIPVFRHLKDKEYHLALAVTGIYIYRDVLYMQIALRNNSDIDYNVQSLRFFIKDSKRSKRTASQELEIKPLYYTANPDKILHQSQMVMAIALPKFTIPDHKYLSLELTEQNGGRNLSLKIKNKVLIKARSI